MSAVDPEEFRSALRGVPSTVAVLLGHDGEEVRGATVTSFASISIDPPRFVGSVGLNRRVHVALKNGSRCSLNILRAGQEDIASHFSSSVSRETGVHPVRLGRSEQGTPIVPGSLVTFECRAEPLGPSAGQELFILEVEAMLSDQDEGDGDPLLWHDGHAAYLEG
jgi:flavin reductase (DIM6/NTAB) family NADH-FMN oxidoreductase RutF